jgi:hypothetical protein
MLEDLHTRKIKLKCIVRQKKFIHIINDFVQKTNILYIHTLQFLRLWILSVDQIPEITKDSFHMCFKALTLKTRGPKPKGDNNLLYQQFLNFYNTTYSKLNYQKINPTNISSISSYAFIQMKTAFDNNIKLHFSDYIKRFVNIFFDKKNPDTNSIKRDIFNHTLNSPDKYHNWIFQHRPHIIPDDYSIQNLYKNPSSYLKYMIYMCKIIEEKGKKPFQFFPQRTNLVPKHITLDTKGLIELFSKNKGEDLRQIRIKQKEIWNKIFKLDHKLFNHNNHKFNYMITTNGYDVSVLFSSDSGYKVRQNRLNIMSEANKTAKRLYKDKTDEEIKQIKKERKELKEKSKPTKTKSTKKVYEFQYLEDISDQEKKEIQNKNIGIIDMGKIRIITMLNKQTGKIFKYTRKQNVRKRLIINRKIQNLKSFITPVETKLSEYNGKTCDVKEFFEYIKQRNSSLSCLLNFYSDEQFRKWRFHMFINKTRDKDKLINKMKEFLGKDPVLIFGNWSANKNIKYMISTPGIGLKREIAKKIISYDIDEFRTSILSCKTGERCKNLYINDKKLHSVLSYKMENNRLGCINRDRNAVLNMEKIVDSILETGKYPEIFLRTTKL